MDFDPNVLPQPAVYKLMIGCVVPRPIAWVSTVDAAGVHNLAPFSYFMAVTSEPPTVAFSSGRRAADLGAAGGTKKDTLANVEAMGEFVVNISDDDTARQMNMTSGEFPPDVDEFAVAGLTAVPSLKVKAPRVAEAPINMECRVVQILPVGAHHLVIGEVVHFHVRDDVYDPASGRLDMHRLRPIGRLAGNLYTHVHDIFEMKRPSDRYIG